MLMDPNQQHTKSYMAQASQAMHQRKESPAHECSLLCLTLLGVQEAHTSRDMEAKSLQWNPFYVYIMKSCAKGSYLLHRQLFQTLL